MIRNTDSLSPRLREVYESDLQSKDQLDGLIWLGWHDGVTGLPNYSAFLYDVQQEIDKRNHFAVLAMDMDDFKGLNERYGHPAVNESLQRIGQAFRQYDTNRLRRSDTVYRLHGDEFGALLRDVKISSWGDFRDRARIIQQTVSGIYVVSDSVPEQTHLSVSIGGAVYGVDGNTIEALHKVADARLSYTKHNGKSGIVGQG